jgi:hypothetical protein
MCGEGEEPFLKRADGTNSCVCGQAKHIGGVKLNAYFKKKGQENQRCDFFGRQGEKKTPVLHKMT